MKRHHVVAFLQPWAVAPLRLAKLFHLRFWHGLSCMGECSFQLFGRDLAFGLHPRKMKRGPQYLFLFQSISPTSREVMMWYMWQLVLQKTLWRDGPGKWNMGAFTRFQRVTLLQSASDLRPEDAALQALCGSLGFVDLLHAEATHLHFQ